MPKSTIAGRGVQLEDFTLKVAAPALLDEVMTDEATALDLLAAVLMFVSEVCVPLIGLSTVCDALDELSDGATAVPWLAEVGQHSNGMTRGLARLSNRADFDAMGMQAHELLWVFVQAGRVVLIRMFPRPQVDGCIAEFSNELRAGRLVIEARRLN